ncbi:hypothetical protein ANOBCDAF_00029 [Pleomorphomonas sp. T1.2MG-36]|nr:hypothetical protein ANOBCDAF_00029 [Pleomorphomonas sp. T1.2MG-36]
MNMKKVLNTLFKEIVQETDTNPAFRARVEAALGLDDKKKPEAKAHDASSPHPKRPSNRRPPAVLDPVHLARQGEDLLRSELAKLDIEQLRDVVADYGMDTGKLVLKWRDSERIIERIIEVARGRAQKGSAFRDQGPGDGTADPADLDDGSQTKT